MNRIINWFGLAAGIVTLVLLAVSLYMPWWQLTVGENLLKVNASPVNTNFGLFGTQFTVPLIWAINLVGILTITACGVIMLIYSLIPTKPYAKHLLGFSYLKPLFIVVSFVVGLIFVSAIAGYLGFGIPLMGSSTFTLPANMTAGATISTLVSGSFQFSFLLAITAAVLSIAARIYHRQIMKNPKNPELQITPVQPNTSN